MRAFTLFALIIANIALVLSLNVNNVMSRCSLGSANQYPSNRISCIKELGKQVECVSGNKNLFCGILSHCIGDQACIDGFDSSLSSSRRNSRRQTCRHDISNWTDVHHYKNFYDVLDSCGY